MVDMLYKVETLICLIVTFLNAHMLNLDAWIMWVAVEMQQHTFQGSDYVPRSFDVLVLSMLKPCWHAFATNVTPPS